MGNSLKSRQDLETLSKIILDGNETDAIKYLESNPLGNYGEMIVNEIYLRSNSLENTTVGQKVYTYYVHNLLSIAIVLDMKELAKKLYETGIYDLDSMVSVSNQYYMKNIPIIYHKNFGKLCEKRNNMFPHLYSEEINYAISSVEDTLLYTTILYLAVLHEHTELVEMIIKDLIKNNKYNKQMKFRPKIIPTITHIFCYHNEFINVINPESYKSLSTSELIAKIYQIK